MLKSEIYQKYETNTRQTYKNQPLYIGDVYKNKLGTKSIVLEEDGKFILVKENGCKFELPKQKVAFEDSEFVANVVQDIDLMNFWIEKGVIIEKEEEKQEEKVEETKKQPKPKTTKAPANTNPKCALFKKINNVRLAWANANIEKEGKGRAGGGAKYDYYKPQQIIDFCLSEELKNNLFSQFIIENETCFYNVVDLDTSEETKVSCPFVIPKKMAASEAQQVGAAMTYHNRRLAMIMYKIEDNSKENVDVLEKADYSKDEADKTNAPFIPAPPIEPVAPKVPTSPVEPPKVAEVQKPIDAPKPPANQNVATENEQKNDTPAGLTNIKPMQVVPPTAPTVPTVPVAQPVPSAPTNNIESLY